MKFRWALVGSVRQEPQTCDVSGMRPGNGFALIEVLVAVLVLGVGLLGMAAMQTVSGQMTNGAEQRTQAILLTADMLDRIRANRGNMASYDNIDISADDVNCQTDLDYDTSKTVAENDIADWGNQLACTLPDGSGTVNVDTATGEVTVLVDWQRQDPDGQPVTVTTVI